MASTINQIKAINERLADMERKGLTGTETYNDILKYIEIEKIETTLSKRGTLRISRSKSNLEALSTADGKRKLQGLAGKKWSTEKRRIKKNLKSEGIEPTEEAIKTRSEQYHNLKEWADNNLSTVYEFQNILNSAAILADNFDFGVRNLDYDLIWSMIRDFETEMDEWRTQALESGLERSNETPLLQIEKYKPYGE